MQWHELMLSIQVQRKDFRYIIDFDLYNFPPIKLNFSAHCDAQAIHTVIRKKQNILISTGCNYWKFFFFSF